MEWRSFGLDSSKFIVEKIRYPPGIPAAFSYNWLHCYRNAFSKIIWGLNYNLLLRQNGFTLLKWPQILQFSLQQSITRLRSYAQGLARSPAQQAQDPGVSPQLVRSGEVRLGRWEQASVPYYDPHTDCEFCSVVFVFPWVFWGPDLAHWQNTLSILPILLRRKCCCPILQMSEDTSERLHIPKFTQPQSYLNGSTHSRKRYPRLLAQRHVFFPTPFMSIQICDI